MRISDWSSDVCSSNLDVDKGAAVATVPDSVGANGPVLLPQFGRGYVAMDDGSLLIFDLQTLKRIARPKLAEDGGLNSGSFDPATGRLHMITGTRPAEATWFTLDAASGKLLSTTRFPFRKMDDTAADGHGHRSDKHRVGKECVSTWRSRG